jgi:anti-anti-sigma factor
MQMTLFERDDAIAHVVLIGRLDTPGTVEISEAFSAATAARDRPVIVDLSGVDFMASQGIGLLLTNGRKLMRAGQKMVLLNPKRLVAAVLHTSGVEKVIPIAHDLDDAVQFLQGIAAQTDGTHRPPESSQVLSALPPVEREPTVAAVRQGELKVTIKNELNELVDLNARLAHFLEAHAVPHRAAYAVNLAIDELVVNVMRYAYVDDDTHWIDIELVVECEQVILRITDDGRPFDPRQGPSLDLHAEDREAGGLGLILVLEMVDVLHYQRVGDKNCVEVRVRLVTEEEDDDTSTGGQDNVG